MLNWNEACVSPGRCEAVAHAQSLQLGLVEHHVTRYLTNGQKVSSKPRRVRVRAWQCLEAEGALIWSAPAASSASLRLYEHLYPWIPRYAALQLVEDSKLKQCIN